MSDGTLATIVKYVPELGQAIIDFRSRLSYNDQHFTSWLWKRVSSNPKALSIILKQSAMIDDLLLENGISLGMHLIDAVAQVEKCPSWFGKSNLYFVYNPSDETETEVSSREEAFKVIAAHLLINKGLE